MHTSVPIVPFLHGLSRARVRGKPIPLVGRLECLILWEARPSGFPAFHFVSYCSEVSEYLLYHEQVFSERFIKSENNSTQFHSSRFWNVYGVCFLQSYLQCARKIEVFEKVHFVGEEAQVFWLTDNCFCSMNFILVQLCGIRCLVHGEKFTVHFKQSNA